MNFLILIGFLLGLFQTELFYLINSIIKHSWLMQTSIKFYFNYIFTFLFKYLFYLYLIFILYNLINFYIQIDDTLLKNIFILSFNDLVNLSTEYNVINNNTTNINSIDKFIENVPRAIATYGAYKAAINISKSAPTLTTKIISAPLIAGSTSGAVSFGTVLGENLAKDMTKNKLLSTMIPNQSNLNLFPYNLLPDMYIMNTCCIGLFIVILNILIVDHIKNINILSYLPNFIKSSKFYIIIEFFYTRYITIWSKSNKVILIISLIFIFIDLFFIQLGLYIIIHHNPT